MSDSSGVVLRAVVADDEPLARLRLAALLGDRHDFTVVAECADGRAALEAIETHRPDVVFLDVQMPEMTGVEVAQALGATGPTVVFVTAYDQYAVRAFELHAIDYLLKPFDEERFADALDRVHSHRAGSMARHAHTRLLALLRELSQGEPARADALPMLRIGDIEVDARAHLVFRRGEPVTLRPKEFELLVALVRRAGTVVTRRELLHDVWGYSEGVASRTVDTHVAELRRKLGIAPGEAGHITTVARAGYRLDP